MIVISFLLVVIAAVTLLVGLFQDTLTWIWASIGACVLAMIFLGIGVLQRRSSRHEPDESDESAYGPGAISSLISGGEEDEEQAAAARSEDISVVPKRSVADAQSEISRAEVEEAADAAVADAEAEAEEAPAERTKKAAKKKTAKKTAKKKTAKKSARKKTAKKTAKKTTGKAARERLDEIKGLGPAKQKALLSEFGSLEAIRDADVEALQQVKGIGAATAEEIQKQLS